MSELPPDIRNHLGGIPTDSAADNFLASVPPEQQDRVRRLMVATIHSCERVETWNPLIRSYSPAFKQMVSIRGQRDSVSKLSDLFVAPLIPPDLESIDTAGEEVFRQRRAWSEIQREEFLHARENGFFRVLLDAVQSQDELSDGYAVAVSVISEFTGEPLVWPTGRIIVGARHLEDAELPGQLAARLVERAGRAGDST